MKKKQLLISIGIGFLMISIALHDAYACQVVSEIPQRIKVSQKEQLIDFIMDYDSGWHGIQQVDKDVALNRIFMDEKISPEFLVVLEKKIKFLEDR